MHSNLYLGIDYGTKRIGLAIGQMVTQTATPLKTLPTEPPIWDALTQVIQEWQVKGIVIGLALQEDGETTPISVAASQFGQHLRKRFQLPVYFIEERLTSVSAREYLQNNPSLAKRHDKDSIAAAIILESWFHSTKDISKDALQSSM